jgi:glucokinase
VGAAAERLLEAAGLTRAQLRGIGVGAPGPVDAERGIVHTLVNVPGWREVPLARLLARRLRRPCRVDNDVNLVALGEWRFGAGAGSRHLVCLTLGTGVGGGLVFDGRLYRGAGGAAGELGHMVMDPDGPRCGCGRRGCFETLVSAPAVVRLAREAMRRGHGPLTALTRAAGGRLTSQLVGRAARAGDARARRVWHTIGRRLGLGLANVVNLLNPDRIVIGGGVAKNWPLFAPRLKATLRAEAMEVSVRGVRVVRARFADQAGVLGAAVLVWEGFGGDAR